MRFVVQGLFLVALLAIVISVGFVSYMASLDPQPKIERIIIPVEEKQYQAPKDSSEKVFSEFTIEAKIEQTE